MRKELKKNFKTVSTITVIAETLIEKEKEETMYLEKTLYFTGDNLNLDILEEIDILLQKIEDITLRLEALKREYNLNEERYEWLDSSELEYFLYHYYDNWKHINPLNKKEYKSIINNIEDILNRKKDLKKKIEKEKEKSIARNKSYDETIPKIEEIDKISMQYDIILANASKRAKELEDLVNKIEEKEIVTKYVEFINQFLIDMALLSGLGTLARSKNLSWIALTSTLSLIMLKGLEKTYTKKSVKITYEAIDYNNEINESLNNLDNTSNTLDEAISKISIIKSKCLEQFEGYLEQIPKFSELIKRMDFIQKMLEEKKEDLKILSLKMKDNLEQNEIKMKQLRLLRTE